MSKTIINIKSLTINLPSGVSHGFPASLIGTLIHGVMSSIGGEEPKTGETTGNATSAASTETKQYDDGTSATGTAPLPDVSPAQQDAAAAEKAPVDVLAFLGSDPRYTLRTADAVSKHFGADDSDEALDILDNLVAGGAVITKRQRGSGVTLYAVNPDYTPVEAPVATEPATEAAPAGAVTDSVQPTETPALTVENVRQFLQSDERYTQRTIASVAKFFNVSLDEAAIKLTEMDDDGDVRLTHRRSDGAALYQVA